jgi:hypothetical protein
MLGLRAPGAVDETGERVGGRGGGLGRGSGIKTKTGW